MRILISNLKGKELLDIAMKNRIEKLISVYTNYNETSLLDQYMMKENIKISTTSAIEASKQLTYIIRSSKEGGNEIFVATDGNFIGSILNFVAAMVYKHINSLMEDGLVGQTKQYEKYYLTNAGKMAII